MAPAHRHITTNCVAVATDELNASTTARRRGRFASDDVESGGMITRISTSGETYLCRFSLC
jgi:hypothetical protein